jgi:spore coat assembly protein SafA
MADTYVVQSGDTLSGIAERFGVSLSDLEEANPQITDPNVIFPGQVINIPSSEPGNSNGGGDKDPEKFKEGKEKDHKDFKDKEHKDHKDHKEKEHKEHKDHKDKEHEKHHKDHEKHHKDHEKEHEGHGGGGSGGSGVHTVGLGPGVTPLAHFIGSELRPDLVQSTLRQEPDLSGRCGEPAVSHDGGSDAVDGGVH